MSRIFRLSGFVFFFCAVSSQAAEVSCIDRWERDHAVNYAKCNEQEKPARAKVAYSSCLDNWERDHSVNLQNCQNEQQSANGAGKPEHVIAGK